MQYPPRPYTDGCIPLGEDVMLYEFTHGAPLVVGWTAGEGYQIDGPANRFDVVRRWHLLTPTGAERKEGLDVFGAVYTDPATGRLVESLTDVRLEGVVNDTDAFVLTDCVLNGQYLGAQVTHTVAQLLEVPPVRVIYTGPFAPEVLLMARYYMDVVVVPQTERVDATGERAQYLAPRALGQLSLPPVP